MDTNPFLVEQIAAEYRYEARQRAEQWRLGRLCTMERRTRTSIFSLGHQAWRYLSKWIRVPAQVRRRQKVRARVSEYAARQVHPTVER